MIDNYLLEELVTFAKYGTLAATAQELLVTQPTVTRGMQKLEDELNVKLFDRQPNHITLTKTGQLAAQEAQKVLDFNNHFVETIQNYETSHQLIKIGAIAPGPIILLKSIAKDLPDRIALTKDFLTADTVADQLEARDFSLIITNQELMTDTVESRYIGTEKLSVNLDKFTYLANKNSVTFSELKGISFVVINDIGIWKQIIQRDIPDAKFLYQDEYDSFTEITKYSSFPYFSTNISNLDGHHQTDDDDRVQIPISDEDSQMDFYASYLKTQRKRLEPTIQQMIKAWSKLN